MPANEVFISVLQAPCKPPAPDVERARAIPHSDGRPTSDCMTNYTRKSVPSPTPGEGHQASTSQFAAAGGPGAA